MATTLAKHISVQKGEDHYVSTYLPQRMGNSAPIGYGGYAISLAIHAAYKEAPEGFHLHSAFGHYLRATSTETNIICRPVQLRKTKSFATYRVEVEQKIESTGESRLCMVVLADFHKDEPALLNYSAPPTRSYSHWQHCVPWDQMLVDDMKTGKMTEQHSKMFTKLFGLSRNLYEGRPCPEGITSQNLMGLLKSVKSNQDDLPVTKKSSADWLRVKHPLPTEGEQMAGLGFMMDGLLSFLPLVHNHLFFDDVDACSSLDFALRIYSPCIKLDDWHLREVTSSRAGHGRTYSESKLWDEKGNLVACMSQQSILRVPSNKAKI
ncbi:thioesterase-like superfamily-domain-containing protein [Aspergillus bertholletiae]|uniref:Thioesterase-like superfamily-domain-containing protein n=1 Tax=Aspergillus bertholletiae TaxID=1226010 RepID=A0A5N7AZT8_9EURO|nr:thioesterase-like superfamily-domain-containing protein [Aspergillus bertholletiae]